MTDKHSLKLPFRGARPYLHGTDLYMAIQGVLGREHEGPISISFHSLLQGQPDLLCTGEGLRELRLEPAFRGEVKLGSGGDVLHAVLLQSEREVEHRKICNEEEVVAGAVLEEGGRGAILSSGGLGLPIEKVVFLNKWLHLQVLPNLSSQWLFAKLELLTWLPEELEGELRVHLEHVLADRFTRSGIYFNNERRGAISFSTPK